MMKKKGMTLIEVVVASGIFMILTSLIVGAFVSFNNTRTLSMKMRNSQEKLRIALEMISRLSRQADEVRIIDMSDYSRLILSNDADDGSVSNASQFIIVRSGTGNSTGSLYYLECTGVACTNFENVSIDGGQDLLGGDLKLNVASSNFSRQWVGTMSYLDIKLSGSSNAGNVRNPYYNDDFSVETGVTLKESY